MNIKKFLQNFVPVFVAAFFVNIIIVNIFNYIRSKTIDFDWESSLALAFTIGIFFAIFENKKDKKKDNENN